MAVSPADVEKLTKNPPNNSVLEDSTNVDIVESRMRRTRSLRARVRALSIVVIILSILLLIAIGFAIHYGIVSRSDVRATDTTTQKAPLENTTHSVDPPVSDPPKSRSIRNVRLPYNVLPRFYDLRLQVHLYGDSPRKFFYNGSVTVKAFCHEKTDVIFVHAFVTLNVSLDQITVQEWNDNGLSTRQIGIKNTAYDSELQWYEIHLEDYLEPGQFYRMTFGQFWSYLETELKGWYLSSYTEKGVQKYLATSQLQPTDARRVFPCWDEPAFKAHFQVTLIRQKDYHSLSNMALNRTEVLPNDWFADVFDPTVNTSTYLLAFVVSQFRALSSVDSKGRNFTVWTRPEVIHMAEYALETGKKIIRFFEEYFEVVYPLDKTDMIAVPDFAAGAMENWGLMIYREATMLWDPNTGTAASQQKVATVISHEVAHQWFGNLVTLSWWDDLWLNEGFASFAEAIGVSHVHPEWGMDEQFLLDDIQKVLVSDSLANSRPVIQSVNFPNEINDIFDPISYNKGASVLRMMESFMGREAFRLGIKKYLSDYMFKNTVHDDLWKSMTEAARASGREIDVKSIMETWLMQMNYPLVTVERIGPRRFRFNQSHYLEPTDAKPPNNPSSYNFQWFIPLTYGDSSSTEIDENNLIWLKNESLEADLDIEPASWYLFNMKQAGFYRVHYSDSNWLKLSEQLMLNHTVIPLHSRIQIIDDLFNLVNRGTVPYTVFLNLTKYLHEEDTYVAWETARRAFGMLTRMLTMDSSFGALQAYIRTIVDKPLKHVDWVTMREDTHHMKHMLRGTITKLACQTGHRECVTKAKTMYHAWMTENSTNNIPPSLRSTVYCTAVQAGGQMEWQHLHRQLGVDNRDEEVTNIRSALSCTRDVWIMRHYLNGLLKQDNLEPTDLLDTVTYIAQNPIGNLLMWDHIRQAWRRMTSEQKTEDGKKTTNMDSAVHMMLKILSKRLYTINNIPPSEEIVELERITQELPEKHGLHRGFKEVFKRADLNRKWSKSHRDVIADWLTRNIPNEAVLL